MDIGRDELIEELFNIDIVFGKIIKTVNRKIPGEQRCILPGSQMMTLITLKNQPPINMTQLSELLGIPRQQLTKIIDALVEKKLVERCSDPDNRRIVPVKISSKGLEYLHQFFGEKIRRMSEFMGILDEEQKKDFMDALMTIKRILSEAKMDS